MEPVSPVSLARPELEPAEIKFADGQADYKTLPGLRHANEFGCVTTRWKLTWTERFRILFTGRMWVSQLTFHRPLQPISFDLTEPPFDITQSYGRTWGSKAEAKA